MVIEVMVIKNIFKGQNEYISDRNNKADSESYNEYTMTV